MYKINQKQRIVVGISNGHRIPANSWKKRKEAICYDSSITPFRTQLHQSIDGYRHTELPAVEKGRLINNEEPQIIPLQLSANHISGRPKERKRKTRTNGTPYPFAPKRNDVLDITPRSCSSDMQEKENIQPFQSTLICDSNHPPAQIHQYSYGTWDKEPGIIDCLRAILRCMTCSCLRSRY